jgi:hypothetical protein
LEKENIARAMMKRVMGGRYAREFSLILRMREGEASGDRICDEIAIA